MAAAAAVEGLSDLMRQEAAKEAVEEEAVEAVETADLAAGRGFGCLDGASALENDTGVSLPG